MKYLTGMVCAGVAALAFAPSARAALSAKSYVRPGLIGHWDGVENVSYGAAHDAAAATWADLTGKSFAITLPGGASFEADGLATLRKHGSSVLTEAQWKATRMYAAYTDAVYTCEIAFNQTNAVPKSSAGYNNQIMVMLMLGRPHRIIGGNGNTQLGFNPVNAGNEWSVGTYATLSTTVGQHTFSCRQNASETAVFADDLSESSTATVGAPETANGFRFNMSYYEDYGINGTYHGMRFYDRALTEDEIAVNRAVDRVRYFGVDAASITLPSGWRWSGSGDTLKLERRQKVSVSGGAGGSVKVAGVLQTADFVQWIEQGTQVALVLTAVPDDGYAFVAWATADDAVSGDLCAAETTLTAGEDVQAVFRKTDGSDPRTYTAASGVWGDRSVWTDGDGVHGLPMANDTVVVPSGVTLALTSSTPTLASVSVAGTLAVSNWTTRLSAQTVTIGATGVVRPACSFGNDEMSNRVWIACTDLTLASGGKIYADLLGYRGWCGPGAAKSTYGAGSHGGQGGISPGPTYGSLTAPEAPGSGGSNAARCGGGAVRIDATGAVTIDGVISAMGSGSAVWNGGGGSGGSVWINCLTISGGGSVKASGADTATAGYEVGWYHGGGGGGRLSVRYDAAAQTAKDAQCNVRFEARGGYSGCMRTTTSSSYSYPYGYGELGTLYFTDNRFLTSETYRTAGWKFSGVWNSGVALPDALSFADGTVFDGCWLDFPKKGMSVTFAGDLTTKGTYARLDKLMLHDARVSVAGDFTLQPGGGFYLEGGSLSVGGDLTMSAASATSAQTGSELQVIAGPTNAADQAGIELKVAGNLSVDKHGLLRLDCCATNGAIPKVTAANVYIATNGSVSAVETGWDFSLGYGKGSGSGYTGGAYGGFGGTHAKGKNRNTYGTAQNPVWPGSSSSNVRGGGVIHITTPGKFRHCGKIDASSSRSGDSWRAGGSGGSVYISCRKLMPSTGTILANGGAGDSYGAQGGGGRIAIYSASGTTNGLTIAAQAGVQNKASAYTNYDPATDGTVYWKRYPPLRVIIR